MATDRRGFLRLLGGTLTLASTGAGAGDRALEIHAQTANTRWGAVGTRLRARHDPLAPFKSYPNASRLGLPAIATPVALPLAEAVRGYAPASGLRATALSLAELSRLLYFRNGVTGRLPSQRGVVHLRAAPSAGALYSGEVYVVARGIRGLDPGVYYYAVLEHQIVALRSGSFMGEVASALDAPAAFGDAPAAVLLTNVFRRYRLRSTPGTSERTSGSPRAPRGSAPRGRSASTTTHSATCSEWMVARRPCVLSTSSAIRGRPRPTLGVALPRSSRRCPPRCPR
jgi:hypothetical protein